MDTDLETHTLSIPSRDKQVQLFFNHGAQWLPARGHPDFRDMMSIIDSTDGQNYREKLRHVLGALQPDFIGVVNNVSTSTHRSLAFLAGETPIHFYGLHDLKHKGSYLAWSTDLKDIQQLLVSDSDPLRYLFYRFPTLAYDTLFLPQERICAQWWTWIKRTDFNALQPFNALERRLFGQPMEL